MKFGAGTIAQLKAIGEIKSLPALEAGAKVILEEMQRLTPVDKGDLLESEAVIVENDTASLMAGTDHALPVEFGTYKMAAQPYMRPALDTKQKEAEQAIADVIEKEMKEAING